MQYLSKGEIKTNVTKTINGGIRISDMDAFGCLFEKTFFFYSVRDAKSEFKKQLCKYNNSFLTNKTEQGMPYSLIT